MEPLLSIVIPIRNAEAFLTDCLASLCAERRRFPFEVVCVDNDSSDRSLEVARTFTERLPLVVLRERTRGAAAARNAGLRAATGRYVWFVDADDTVAEDAFSVFARSLSPDADLFVFGARVIEYGGEHVLEDLSPPDALYEAQCCLPAFYAEPSCRPYVWNTVYRRAFLTEHELTFPENCRTGEDVAFQFLCFDRAKKVRFRPERIYTYHHLRNAGSLMAHLAGKEAERIADCFAPVSVILAKRRKGASERAFGKWLYEYLLLPILNLRDRGEQSSLMKRAHDELFAAHVPDFSALPLRDRLKCRCFTSDAFRRAYLAFKAISE